MVTKDGYGGNGDGDEMGTSESMIRTEEERQLVSSSTKIRYAEAAERERAQKGTERQRVRERITQKGPRPRIP